MSFARHMQMMERKALAHAAELKAADAGVRADGGHWMPYARVSKFTAAQVDACRTHLGLDRDPISVELFDFCTPDSYAESIGNGLTRQGRKRLIDRLVGTASNQAIDATHARIGTGDSSTAYADTQTDLQASTNKYWQLVDSAPSIGSGASSGVVTCVSTFPTGQGNYAWQEWGIDGGTASSSTVTTEGNTTPGMINRKVSSLGTKTSAASWVFTVTITLT